MGSVANLYGSVSGSSAWVNVASYDPPLRGTIDGLMLAWSDDADADGDLAAAHITFSSTPAAPVNGDYSSLLYVAKQFQIVTSGGVNNGARQYCAMPHVPIAPGQRVYLHVLGTTGVAISINCSIHLSFSVPR